MQRKYQKYKPEQLERALSLYLEDRKPDKGSRGRYTLAQIQAMTGVNYGRIFKYCNPKGAGI